MPFGIGVWEIAVLLLVALLVFGPKRLPEMGRGLGRGMREFKDSVSGITKPSSTTAPSSARSRRPPSATPPSLSRPAAAVLAHPVPQLSVV